MPPDDADDRAALDAGRAAGRERHRFAAAVEEALDKFTIPADWEPAAVTRTMRR
jgi:hypothetical protein